VSLFPSPSSPIVQRVRLSDERYQPFQGSGPPMIFEVSLYRSRSLPYRRSPETRTAHKASAPVFFSSTFVGHRRPLMTLRDLPRSPFSPFGGILSVECSHHRLFYAFLNPEGTFLADESQGARPAFNGRSLQSRSFLFVFGLQFVFKTATFLFTLAFVFSFPPF